MRMTRLRHRDPTSSHASAALPPPRYPSPQRQPQQPHPAPSAQRQPSPPQHQPPPPAPFPHWQQQQQPKQAPVPQCGPSLHRDAPVMRVTGRRMATSTPRRRAFSSSTAPGKIDAVIAVSAQSRRSTRSSSASESYVHKNNSVDALGRRNRPHVPATRSYCCLFCCGCELCSLCFVVVVDRHDNPALRARQLHRAGEPALPPRRTRLQTRSPDARSEGDRRHSEGLKLTHLSFLYFVFIRSLIISFKTH